MSINIIATRSAEHLIGSFSKDPDFRMHEVLKNKDSKRSFPDGEVYVRLGDIEQERTVVLFSGAPNPNENLIELEFILQILKEKKIESVELFITYFPYSRQDMVFLDGELNVSEFLIKKWLDIYGVKKIYIIDAHFKGRDWVDKYPIEHISCIDILKDVATLENKDITFIAPDAGSARRNNIPGFEKKRINSYEVEISLDKDIESSIKNKTVGIIDDMVETGGTMIKVCKKCKEIGVLKTIALVTHGVIKEGMEKINKDYDKTYLTNTINSELSNVDISGLVIHTLKKN